MEYIDGPTLAELIAHGPLDRADAAAVGRDLADALAAVHASGAVHRDVKPSNVLLRPSLDPSHPWHAVLADFGIARGTDDTALTAPGITIGTVAYMAPELFRGARATPAADVYALGVLLLEALTGARPSPAALGTDAARASGPTVPDAPGGMAPPTVPDALGTGWALLLGRMTAAEPEERPSAAQVAAAAADLLCVEDRTSSAVGLPTRSRGSTGGRDLPSRSRRAARRWSRGRTRGLVAVCAGVLIALALAVAGLGGLAHPDPPEAQPSVPGPSSEPTPLPSTPVAGVPSPAVPQAPVVPAADVEPHHGPGRGAAAHAGQGGDPGPGSDHAATGNPHDRGSNEDSPDTSAGDDR
ncbi:serine/threonine-protein kinase [Microbacterium xylanilyticum]